MSNNSQLLSLAPTSQVPIKYKINPVRFIMFLWNQKIEIFTTHSVTLYGMVMVTIVRIFCCVHCPVWQ